jgi:site-specific DNA-adenine methylase
MYFFVNFVGGGSILFSLNQDLSLSAPPTKFTKKYIMTSVNALFFLDVTADIASC